MPGPGRVAYWLLSRPGAADSSNSIGSRSAAVERRLVPLLLWRRDRNRHWQTGHRDKRIRLLRALRVLVVRDLRLSEDRERVVAGAGTGLHVDGEGGFRLPGGDVQGTKV